MEMALVLGHPVANDVNITWWSISGHIGGKPEQAADDIHRNNRSVSLRTTLRGHNGGFGYLTRGKQSEYTHSLTLRVRRKLS